MIGNENHAYCLGQMSNMCTVNRAVSMNIQTMSKGLFVFTTPRGNNGVIDRPVLPFLLLLPI